MSEAREDLFNEWSKLEPERCSRHRLGGFVAGNTHFRSFQGIASDALLRREVQLALQARGWEWQIDLGYPVQAAVTLGTEGQRFAATAAEYPGEALLRAYLATLRRLVEPVAS